jgi:CheY-like chemotaxis protein
MGSGAVAVRRGAPTRRCGVVREAGAPRACAWSRPFRRGPRRDRPVSQPAGDGAGLATQTILLVEDDPAVRTLLVATLGRAGRRLVEVGEGAAVVEAARRWRPDLVLLDVGLPGVDGFGVCEQLRADPATRGCTIWFLSARTSDVDRERGARAGADAYLAKPFSPIALRTLVDRHFGGRGTGA